MTKDKLIEILVSKFSVPEPAATSRAEALEMSAKDFIDRQAKETKRVLKIKWIFDDLCDWLNQSVENVKIENQNIRENQNFNIAFDGKATILPLTDLLHYLIAGEENVSFKYKSGFFISKNEAAKTICAWIAIIYPESCSDTTKMKTILDAYRLRRSFYETDEVFYPLDKDDTRPRAYKMGKPHLRNS